MNSKRSVVEEIGQRQFSDFVEDRLKVHPTNHLSDIVSKNKLALFIHLKQSRGQEARNKSHL